MMTRVLLSALTSLLMACGGLAQQINLPPIQWQRAFGGTGADTMFGICETPEGGFLLGGYSSSGISGSKTNASLGGRDAWIVRLDALGNEVWERSLGGPGEDGVSKLKQAAGGGFILGGYSTSAVAGTKTSPNWGSYDYWLVRIDASGNQVWDKSFGGSAEDAMEDVIQTTDGGFLLAGYSFSGQTGNKTSPFYGGTEFGDGWLVRLDANGTFVCDTTYGGTGSDTLENIRQLPDNGFVVSGFSSSGQSGNKISPAYGDYDAWVLRLDASGTVVWDQTCGGSGFDESYRIVPTTDGGFALGTHSASTDGNKTSPCFGSTDYWIVRLDTNGVPSWQHTFGGSGTDNLRFVAATHDGGFLLGGRSTSAPSGNKTSPAFGGYDFWIIRLNADGSKLWEMSFGGNRNDECFDGYQTADGGYILGGRSYSGISGNKTVSNFGDADFWVVKLGPEPPGLRALSQSQEEIGTNGFRFFLNGVSGNYAIEISSNLTSWSVLQTNQITSSGVEVQVSDTGAGGCAQRFYRACCLR